MKFFFTFLLFATNCTIHAEIAELRVVLANRPDSLSPAQVVSQEGHLIAKHIFETLIVRGFDGTFRGGLAERWQFNSAHTELTIWLKPNRVFSNGAKVTPDDVVAMVHSCQQKKINLSFQKIRRDGIQVIDERTVRLTFERENPEILNDLTSVQSSIVRLIDGREFGTGPFYIVADNSSKGDFNLELQRNPHFTDRPVQPAQIIFSTDSARGDIALTATSELPLSLQVLTAQVDALGFNLGSRRLKDLPIRQALVQVLSTDLLHEVLGTLDYKVGGLIPPGLVGHSDTTSTISNPNLLALLKNRKFKVFQYNSYSSVLAQRYCERLNKIGAYCTFKQIDIPTLLKAHRSNSLEILFVRMAPSYPSVEDLLSLFSSSSQINFFLSRAPTPLKLEVNALFEKLRLLPENSAEERRSIAMKIDTTLVNNAVVKPYSYGVYRKIFYRRGLQLPNIGIMGPLDLDLASVDEVRP